MVAFLICGLAGSHSLAALVYRVAGPIVLETVDVHSSVTAVNTVVQGKYLSLGILSVLGPLILITVIVLLQSVLTFPNLHEGTPFGLGPTLGYLLIGLVLHLIQFVE